MGDEGSKIAATARPDATRTKNIAQLASGHVAHAIDRRFERIADMAWCGLKRRPYFGVAVTVGVTLGLATVVGIPELLLTAGAGYVAYQVLKLDVPPSKAIRKAARVEEGLL
jgi:hypothetical protein